jgi:hypothetical protein
MTTETLTEKKYKDVAFNENEYLALIGSRNFTQDVDFSIVPEDTKTSIEDKDKEIRNFLAENNKFDSYTEEEKDKLFTEITGKWNELKDLIKNAKARFDLSGLEISVITRKLHQNIEYSAETVFYGAHVKHTFLNNLPTKASDMRGYNVEITFTNAVLLYNLLSTISVKGLNLESFAFANILWKLSEISKAYTHYNKLSEITSKNISVWNMGLSADDAKKLQTEVLGAMIAEKQEELNSDVEESAE